ncbi:MAG: Uma2 family endonuclease [Chloroflexia bacterium]
MAVEQIQQAEQFPLTRRLFTLEEYERMIDAGVFDEDERIELIRGEIVQMAPIGLPHAACVARLTALMAQTVLARAIIWPQNNPIYLPPSSRPEPDLTLLRWRDDYYAGNPPDPEDVILVVEVADTSIAYDRRVKGRLYAEAAIPEYWIANLQDQIFDVYTQPVDGVYKRVRKARRGETLPLPGDLEGSANVTDILGEPSE